MILGDVNADGTLTELLEEGGQAISTGFFLGLQTLNCLTSANDACLAQVLKAGRVAQKLFLAFLFLHLGFNPRICKFCSIWDLAWLWRNLNVGHVGLFGLYHGCVGR